MKKKRKAENSFGWLLVERPKHVALYKPEKGIFSMLLRHFPLWGPLLLLGPKMIQNPSWLFIYLFTGLPIGIIASSRELIPTFFVNEKKCGFGTAHQFKPENGIILTRELKENEIYVADTKKGFTHLVWDADSIENYDNIISLLRRFIPNQGTLKAEPDGSINSEAAAST